MPRTDRRRMYRWRKANPWEAIRKATINDTQTAFKEIDSICHKIILYSSNFNRRLTQGEVNEIGTMAEKTFRESNRLSKILIGFKYMGGESEPGLLLHKLAVNKTWALSGIIQEYEKSCHDKSLNEKILLAGPKTGKK